MSISSGTGPATAPLVAGQPLHGRPARATDEEISVSVSVSVYVYVYTCTST